MNNIKKAFKNKAKCGLRMAQGGLLTPAQYGDASEAGLQTRLQALQTQPLQATATKPAGDPAGSVGIMNDPTEAENAEKTARWRQDELVKKAAYSPDMRGSMDISQMAIAAPKPVSTDPTQALNAERAARWREDDLMSQMRYGNRGLRMAEGGIVRGEGGPTDDEVPMRVAGKDVHLSNTEAVLPGKTVQALGGPKAVEALIESTNGKPPVKGGLRAGGDYATGVVGDQIDPRELRPEFRSQAATPVIEPAANPGLEAARNTRAAGAMGAMPEAGAPYVQPQAAAPAAPVAAEAAQVGSRGLRAGQAAANFVKSTAPSLKSFAGTGLAAAGTGIAAYDAHNEAAKHDDFFKDPEVPFVDKAAQAGRDVYRAGVPFVASAIGSGVAPVAGTIAGAAVGTGLRAMTDAEGSALKDYAHTKLVRQNDKVLNSGAGQGTITLPALDKEKAQRDTALAQSNGRLGAAAEQAQADEAKQAGLRAAGNMLGQNRQLAAVTQGDTAASEAMGDVVDRLTGVSRGSNMGLRGMAQRFDAYTNNDSARAARNAQLQLRGDGARFEKDGNGKLVITNSGDFDGSTKMPYTDANGNPTAVHTGSQQHRQGLRDAANLKTQLATMQQNRLERNAGEDITDEGLRNYSRHALETQGRQAAELTKAQIARAPTALDLDKHQLARDQFALDQQKAGNAQENAARNFKASQSAQVTKLIDSALDTQAPTTGLKDDELKKAQSKRADLETALYAAHKRMPGDDAEYAKSMPGMMRQAKLSVAMRDAIQNRGLWNKITNLGRDPWQTLNAVAPKREGDMFVFDNGFSIPVKEVIGKDADLLAAYEERVNSR